MSPLSTTHYLACDLGAESGRVVLGTLDGGRLTLREVHRFLNVPLRQAGTLCWDVPALFDGFETGLRKAASLNLPMASVSCDSWGVDYILYGADGQILPPTYHYRDPRTERGVSRVSARVPWAEVFAETGIQFMPLNTLYQLAAEPPERLRHAARMLLIGDAFNAWLCGVARAEVSLASTTQLYNPTARAWSMRLLEALELPAAILPPIVASGTRLGRLRPELARRVGLPEIEVIAACSHDTGAAVAGVPATTAETDWAYISSGTWSLMGVERQHPVITAASREFNFTNELGFGGTIRLLKNISGLWLLQECRRSWQRQGLEADYTRLTEVASNSPPFAALIQPADAGFLNPPDMPAAIAEFCRRTGQTPPATQGATVRCTLESLALLYRVTADEIATLLGSSPARVHIVGGGSKNHLLNQCAADALQIPVLAGPVEATAAGNIMIQAIALGHVPSLAAARQIIADSIEITRYEPQAAAAWGRALDRFRNLGSSSSSSSSSS
jgi:rhamnulokinase